MKNYVFRYFSLLLGTVLPLTGCVSYIQIKWQSCNVCFGFVPAGDSYEKLVAYNVNSVRQEDYQLTILK